MGVRDTSLALLNQLDKVVLKQHDHEAECCGFGGTFSVRHPHISAAMVEDKTSALKACGVQQVVSADCACLLNINGALEKQGAALRGQHIADLSQYCCLVSDKILSISHFVRYMYILFGQEDAMRGPSLNLKSQISHRVAEYQPGYVWTPVDFLDLGPRDAIDKALQRLVTSGDLRRVDRGLYDQPRHNALTGKAAAPDYRSVIDAVSRRDQIRVLVDGMTAANALGLTNAVPAQVVVHTDGRLRPIHLGNLTIQFRLTAASKLYWAGRPAMQIVQALHWLRDTLSEQRDALITRLKRLLASDTSGVLRDDLRQGLPTLPAWMQDLLREVLKEADEAAAGGKPYLIASMPSILPIEPHTAQGTYP